VGENKSSTEEGCIVSPAGNPDDSISHESHTGGRIVLIRQVCRSVEERTPVLAAVVDGVTPHLVVGKGDRESDQIKFRLSDCEFAYGDFRDATAEDFGAHKFEGFLVVASSKGDTLSLFELKR
jgi:hypothetical protein